MDKVYIMVKMWIRPGEEVGGVYHGVYFFNAIKI